MSAPIYPFIVIFVVTEKSLHLRKIFLRYRSLVKFHQVFFVNIVHRKPKGCSAKRLLVME